MILLEQITNDMKAAMKAKDSAALSTLRMLKSAIKNKQIDTPQEMTEEEVQAVVKSQVKQLKDSIASFQEGGREEMAEGAKAEVAILEKYLPAQMEDDALESVVKQVIEETGATSKADMGKVMGAAMKAVAGGADGNRVKAIVAKLLPVIALALILPAETFAAIPLVEQTQTTVEVEYIEVGLRIFRVVVLWFGLFSLLNIMKGGFEYTTASMRDATHLSAWQKMTQGFIGTVIVAGLFAVATVYLNQIA